MKADNETDVCGTVRKGRKQMAPLLECGKLKKDQQTEFFERKYKFLAMRWNDKKEVRLINTFHTNTEVQIIREKVKDPKKKAKTIPSIVNDYNKFMGELIIVIKCCKVIRWKEKG
uniref:DDE_Tnp_1_7 domain-containing protein n=1 Tax=Parastrongyloides trichosuri TaxID=131310 RepID=A0A0N5A062_PARTI